MPVSKKRKSKKKKSNNTLMHKQLQESAYSKLKQKVSDMSPNFKLQMGGTKEKVSGLILDYGKDIISPDYEKNFNKKMIPLLIMCWNAGVKVEHAEEGTRQIIESLQIEDKEVQDLIKMLVARKVLLYSQYKYLIVQYDLSFPAEGKLHLSVASKELD